MSKADEYYRQDGTYEICNPNSSISSLDWGDFDGLPVEGLGEEALIYPQGKFRRRLSNSILKTGIFTLAHSSVWAWYMHTFDNSLQSNQSWFSIPPTFEFPPAVKP